MESEAVVIVVGSGPVLDSALDAQTGGGLPVRRISTAREAELLLGMHERPLVGAVLVSLVDEPTLGLDLVQALRSDCRLRLVPIAVWASVASAGLVEAAYRRGATSALLMQGDEADSAQLARAIHYWAALNEPWPHDGALGGLA